MVRMLVSVKDVEEALVATSAGSMPSSATSTGTTLAAQAARAASSPGAAAPGHTPTLT